MISAASPRQRLNGNKSLLAPDENRGSLTKGILFIVNSYIEIFLQEHRPRSCMLVFLVPLRETS